MIKATQLKLESGEWTGDFSSIASSQLCLLFGSRLTIEENPNFVSKLEALAPNATIVTSSTAGNIMDEALIDDTIIATCLEFEKTTIKTRSYSLVDRDAHDLGENIAHDAEGDELEYLLLLSTVGINAGQLLSGVNEVLKGNVPVSGGVAGDDSRFERTLVGLGNQIHSNQIVAVSFYGKDLQVSHGSKGGWDTFGPERIATKCDGNILYEIDGRPVLDLYKEYLGDKASELPASALHFPFAIIDSQTNEHVVRGVQDVDESSNSIILFSDVHEGDKIQLMKANFDRVITASGDSARETFLNTSTPPQLALLISCVARRLVLDQLTEEELSEAKSALGSDTTICGFYSYSELSPIVGDNACHVHNQTMTITTLSEI
jgi:hypothetical protein